MFEEKFRKTMFSKSWRLSPIKINIFIIIIIKIIVFMTMMKMEFGECSPIKPLLRGVTIRNWPYADRINDRYEGFVVDLMHLLAEKVNFSYRLYFAPDGKYGTEFSRNQINGMIGEVYRNRADFAIADLTVTESRKRYVNFTEPFLENQLAAIIRREDAIGLTTLEDLVRLNEQQSQPVISYGTYRSGSTFYHLAKSRDPVGMQMYRWMQQHPETLVSSAKEGFDRVNAGHYAFIVESTFAEYLTGIYCNLTMLYDTRSLYPRKFAIALAKGSEYVRPFNKAIEELRANGTIQRLKQQYWTNRCKNDHIPVSPSLTSSSSTTTTTASSSTLGEFFDPYSSNQFQGSNGNPQQEINNNNNRNTANSIKFEWNNNNHHNQGQSRPGNNRVVPNLPPNNHPHYHRGYHHVTSPPNNNLYGLQRNRKPSTMSDYDSDLLFNAAAANNNNPFNSSRTNRWSTWLLWIGTTTVLLLLNPSSYRLMFD